jgi:hypothetical protein
MRRQPIVLIAPVALGALLAGSACELPCARDCPRGQPVEGGKGDFKTGPVETDAVRIEAPAACSVGGGEHVRLVGLGTRPVPFTSKDPGGLDAAWFDGVVDELEGQGVAINSTSWGRSCTEDGVAYILEINDWALADDIALTVVSALERDDIDGTVEILVRPWAPPCADIGCGY